MEINEKKELLMRYRYLMEEISDIGERFIRLRSLAEKVTPTLTGMPSGFNSDGDKIQRCVDAISDLQEKYRDKLTEAILLQKTIETALDRMEDNKEERVLRLRYINGLEWDQIASRMNFEKRYIYKIHNAALFDLKIEKQDTKRH